MIQRATRSTFIASLGRVGLGEIGESLQLHSNPLLFMNTTILDMYMNRMNTDSCRVAWDSSFVLIVTQIRFDRRTTIQTIGNLNTDSTET